MPVDLPPPASHFEYNVSSSQSQLPTSLQPLMSDLSQLARAHAKDRNQKIPVIAIGGCPGVGKTYITDELLKDLQSQEIQCAIVRFDDWTFPPDRRQTDKGAEDYFDLDGIHAFFHELSSGNRKILKPTMSEFTDEHSTEILDVSKVDLILFEGLLSLSTEEGSNYFPYCDRGVFIEAQPRDIWRWKQARPTVPKRTEEEFAAHMEIILKYHREHIDPSKANASWIIHKGADHQYVQLEARSKLLQESGI